MVEISDTIVRERGVVMEVRSGGIRARAFLPSRVQVDDVCKDSSRAPVLGPSTVAAAEQQCMWNKDRRLT
jgi:hypothetical protein